MRMRRVEVLQAILVVGRGGIAHPHLPRSHSILRFGEEHDQFRTVITADAAVVVLFDADDCCIPDINQAHTVDRIHQLHLDIGNRRRAVTSVDVVSSFHQHVSNDHTHGISFGRTHPCHREHCPCPHHNSTLPMTHHTPHTHLEV